MSPRYRGWSLVMLAALAGCSTNNTYGAYIKAVSQMAKSSLSGGNITRGQATAISYATIGYRLNGSAERILVLATSADGKQMWTSASHVVLLMSDGHIIRSVGLPRDIVGLQSTDKGGAPAIALALRTTYASHWTADFPDLGVYSAALRCETSAIGLQTITILGTDIAAIRVDERCTSAEPRWSFTNSYWLDVQNQFIWRTRQQINPHGDVIDVEILRPPE